MNKERCKSIYELHASGMKYSEIAQQLEISSTRVRQLSKEWEYHQIYENWIEKNIPDEKDRILFRTYRDYSSIMPEHIIKLRQQFIDWVTYEHPL